MSGKFVELTDFDDDRTRNVHFEEHVAEVDPDDDQPTPLASQVPLQERHPLEFTVILIGATALSFNAGFVNGCTYQVGNMPVSHVTGTTTHAGLNIGNNEWDKFAINMAVVISFVFGAGITGTYMPDSSFQLGKEYGPLFLAGSGLFALACMTEYMWPNYNYYFYFAAMACGLQNALTSKYSGNIIRTTHMTGTATDIGLVLGRLCRGETKEVWKLYVLCPIYVAFLLGGAVSVPVFKSMGRLSLLINVLVFFSIGLAYSVVVGQQMHIPFWQAFFGCYSLLESKIKSGSAKAKVVVHRMHDKLHEMTHKSHGSNPLHAERELDRI